MPSSVKFCWELGAIPRVQHCHFLGWGDGVDIAMSEKQVSRCHTHSGIANSTMCVSQWLTCFWRINPMQADTCFWEASNNWPALPQQPETHKRQITSRAEERHATMAYQVWPPCLCTLSRPRQQHMGPGLLSSSNLQESKGFFFFFGFPFECLCHIHFKLAASSLS